MPDSTISQAIKEAYAAAPADDVILHTLEFRHPDIVDGEGQPMAIRVVRDHADLVATLEQNAPLNGGEMVEFTSLGFDISLPPVETSPAPELVVTLDNASRLLMSHLDLVSISQTSVQMTYRPYLISDLSTPQMNPPLTLNLINAQVTASQVSLKGRVFNIGNIPFPGITYRLSQFPGISP